MIKQIFISFILLFNFISYNSFAQKEENLTKQKKVSKLFKNDKVLELKLNFSIKELKKKTNDSTFIASNLSYLDEDGTWKKLDIDLRTRGNFRLNKCYFPPLKIKIDKDEGKGTLFKGNKKLKLVMPCLLNNDNNDYVIKEYMAYKMYEIITPYHFKTRLVDLKMDEIKGKKTRAHDLYGIFIEDDKKVAKRFDGKVVKRNIHPIAQDALSSVRNSFFQFMIGNIDYSTAVQHNGKILYINKNLIPVPYDFDLSGLVNASYATVPIVNGEPLVSSNQERLYRGFKRDPKIIAQVRKEFIDNKIKLLDIMYNSKVYMEDQKEFSNAKIFISSFFKIIEDDKLFQSEIIDNLRTK